MARRDVGYMAGDQLPRSLPKSEEAEKAVLGAILLDPELIHETMDRLRPEHFYFERHNLLYAAMVAIQETEEVPDLRTIQSRLEASGQWETIGGVAYLASLDIDLPDPGRLSAYVDIVLRCWTARAFIERCSRAIAETMASYATPAETIGRLAQEIDGLIRESHGDGFRHIKDRLDVLLLELEEPEENQKRVKTGLSRVDSLLRWFRPGRVYFLGGDPKTGKTSLALKIIRHNAKELGEPVGIISLEMDESELIERLLSAESLIPAERISDRAIKDHDWSAIHEGYRRLRALPIYIDDNSADLQTIVARCRRLALKLKPRLLVLDYIGLVEGPDKENRQNEVASISRRLVRLAKELGIPFLVLVQLRRRPGNVKPTAADLRDSGAQAQDAYAVILCWREMTEDGQMGSDGEIIIDLHRGGATGPVPIEFIGPLMDFREVTTDYADNRR